MVDIILCILTTTSYFIQVWRSEKAQKKIHDSQSGSGYPDNGAGHGNEIAETFAGWLRFIALIVLLIYIELLG